MIAHRNMFALIASLVAVATLSPARADPALLTHNPFSRPPSAEVSGTDNDSNRGDRSTQVLELRATMVGTKILLVDIGGRILRPGDEIQGYTLLHVLEDRAVFENQGGRVTVYVKPELVEKNE